MESEWQELLHSIVKFFTNRLFILFIVVGCMFYILVTALFNIQIVNGNTYQITVDTSTKQQPIPITAPRGIILDRYGRPLATNEVAFTAKIDPMVNTKLDPEAAKAFIEIMEKNGEKIIDNFPLSKTQPYTFQFSGTGTSEARWKEDMGVPKDATAQEAFDHLRAFFKIPEETDDDTARKILSLCNAVYLERIRLNQITIAVNINDRTVAALEERNQDFPGFYVDVDYLRNYPGGENFSHMLGYIRTISSEELAQKKEAGIAGYDSASIVGQSGLELAFESELKGENGQMIAEINKEGRRVSTSRVADPVQGDTVVLTIDAALQNKSAAILEDMLKQLLISKLKGTAIREEPITPRQLLASMVNANNISIGDIMNAPAGSYSYAIQQYVSENFTPPEKQENYDRDLKRFVASAIEENQIGTAQMLLVMLEQDIITLTEDQISSLRNSNYMVLSILIEKLESGEITPQMTYLKPSTGSVVVVDIHNGDILAAASYPTYDNNQLVNSYNNDYIRKLMNDPSSPVYYRAVSEPRAPGSTFKMITALAGLENGIITGATRITDKGKFMDSGPPYPSCWVHTAGYHGTINVTQALEVSCNYFFYDTAYHMGNTASDTKYEGIGMLNRYMEYFGLNTRSGVEIGEYADTIPADVNKMSSPEFKAYIQRSRDSSLTDSQVRWVDGDTVRTAIGQSFNNYTAAVMAKYIATLANGGDRYQLHFLNRIESSTGETLSCFDPKIELSLDLKPENLKLVYDGMLAVTQGDRGTARSVFAGFPMPVGGKTGTAQEADFNHASFACFAPYDKPQIAVYVVIPDGDTLTTIAPAAQVARDVLAFYFGLDQEPQQSFMNNSLAE